MFSTQDGAKKAAKKLKRTLDGSGFEFPLHKCQTAIARAAGYRDWMDLGASLGGTSVPRTLEPEVYARRLVRALPDPCVPAALALLEGRQREPHGDEHTPPNWWDDVFPYLFAIAVLHRSKTAILRPGSGQGQKLRENLVVGLLLNRHGGRQAVPTLDPENLALIYRGDLEGLYHADYHNPRFPAELEVLVEAGIIELLPNGLRILPPDREAVGKHVLSSWIDKAGERMLGGGKAALDTLGAALSVIGVPNALRVANAIMQFGSTAFDRHSGAALELLSSLAEQGDLSAFAKTVRLFEAIFPQSKRQIRESVPAKISSLYLARHRGIGGPKQMAYMNRHPDWAERLRDGAADPLRFADTVDAMAADIEGA